MIPALLLATLAGALLGALICKGVKLKLWLDILAGVGATAGTWGAAMLAGSSAWPLAGLAAGFSAVVLYLRRSPA